MEPLRPDDPPAVGSFRLRARLGAGGMGRVYLAASPAGRAVAIKVIHPELAHDETFRSRFRREVAAARQVSGAYTAPVVAAGLDGDPLWLATAFVAGPSLAAAVETRGAFPEPSLWRLAAGLIEALGAVHAAGLIHRDLKPANVLLAEDGPRLIDFGIARALDGTAITASGHIVGTPAFMSPEQAEDRFTGPASDVFSLGSVLAYTASGRSPFGTDRPATILYRVVHGEPTLGGVPAGPREVIRRCLAKEPADRPSLADLAAAVAVHWTPAGDGPLGPFWPETLDGLVRAHAAEVAAAAGTSPSAVGADRSDLRSNSSPPATDERPSGAQPATAGIDTVTAFPAAAAGRGPAAPERPAPERPAPAGPDSRRPDPGPARRPVLLALAGLVAIGAGVGAWELGQGRGTATTPPTGSTGTPTPAGTRTGPATAAPVVRSASKLWRMSLGQDTVASPAVAAGVVYTGAAVGLFYARDAVTGRPRWHYDVGGVTAGPVLAGGSVYVLGGIGNLYAFSTSGSLRWKYAPFGGTVYGFIVAGGVVYAAGDQTVYALQPANGGVAWHFSTSNTINTGLAAADGTVYAANNGNSVYAIRSGHQVWQKTVGQTGENLFAAQLAVGDGGLFTGASDHNVYALQAAGGTPSWKFPTSNSVHGGPVVTGGVVYAGSSDGNVYAIGVADGRQRWKFETRNEVVGKPVVSNSVVYVADASGYIYALGAADGKPRWKYATGKSVQTSLAVAGNVVYAGDTSGGLWAVRAPA
ncbi:MAG TPA: serine/threonine-protein kinase [Streptosporangiaceae bacterium]|nr:serine/threonine-protein kinase [Streptosporangiaceae bacterium]